MDRRKKKVTIYLESWQRRMLEAYLPAYKEIRSRKTPRRIIYEGEPGDCLASYMVIQNWVKEREFDLYLTDQQRLQVATELKIAEESVVAITLSPQAIEKGTIRF